MTSGSCSPIVLVCASLLSMYAAPAAAQDESALRSFFEGQRVTVADSSALMAGPYALSRSP